MIIDFSNIEEKELANFRGGEKDTIVRMFTDELNKIFVSRLVPGASIGLHTHEDGCEIIYVLEGTGKALYDDGEERLSVGQSHYCPKGHSHSLINDSEEDFVFFAVVALQ